MKRVYSRAEVERAVSIFDYLVQCGAVDGPDVHLGKVRPQYGITVVTKMLQDGSVEVSDTNDD